MIFSKVVKKTVQVEIKRSIGRGNDTCEFLIKLEGYFTQGTR